MDEPGTVVAESGWVWVMLWLVCPPAGAGLLWALWLSSHWIASLPAAPLQLIFGIAADIPQPWAGIGATVLGLAAGAVFAAHVWRDSMIVRVSPQQVTISQGGHTRTLPRGQVGALFLDGKELVVLDPDSQELDRRANDRDPDALAEALRHHGYPWCRDDPHRSEFRRWVPGLPDLPPAAEALLAARQRALEKKDRDEAAQLRDELARLGVVVREEQTRQFWRRIWSPGQG